MELINFHGKGRHPLVMNACDDAAEYLYPAFNNKALIKNHTDQEFLIQIIYLQEKFDLKKHKEEFDFIENQINLGRFYTITELINKYTYGLLYEHQKIDVNEMIHDVMNIMFESKKKLIDLFINRNHTAGYIHLGKYYQAKEFIDIIDLFYNLKKGDKNNVNFGYNI